MRLDQTVRSIFLTEFVSAFFLAMRYFFKPKGDAELSVREGVALARFRGELALRRYPNGGGALHRCARRSALHKPIDAEPRRYDGTRRTTRFDIEEMHLLRLLPGGLPRRRYRPGAELRVRDRDTHKGRLLANGDRWERQIAKNISLDAPYR